MLFPNLKNFWLNIKRDKILVGILAFGLILRGLNPTFGSPSLYVSNDEAVAHLAALNMLAAKTPVSIANYTPLGAYVQIPFLAASYGAMRIFGSIGNLGDFRLFILTHGGYFLFISRLMSAMFGTLMILVIYKLTRLLFGIKSVGLIAAFFCAVSFNLVHISHFGRPWAGALFFFLLAFYKTLKNKTFFPYILTGLSYGFHQVGIFALPFLIFFLKKSTLKKNLVGIFIAAILVFIFSLLTLKVGIIKSIENEQSFLKPHTIIVDFLAEKLNINSFVSTLKLNSAKYYLVNLFFTDGILLVFGIWGMVKAARSKTSSRILIIYIFCYFLFASFFFYPLLRYLLPAIMLLIPFAAFGVYSIFNRRTFFIILLLAIASINSLWWNWLYLKTPTFIQAASWVNKHIPESVPIAYNGGRFQVFAPSKPAIAQMQKFSPKSYKELQTILPNTEIDNVRNIVYLDKIKVSGKFEQVKEVWQNYQVKYMIDYYLDPVDSLIDSHPGNFYLITRFNPDIKNRMTGIAEPLFDATSNFDSFEIRKNLSMYSLTRIGPYFDILGIKDLSQK